MKKLPNSNEEFNALSPEEKQECIKNVKLALANDQLVEDSDEHKRLIECLSWFPDEVRKEIGNATKRRNRILIANAVKKYVEKNGILPSGLELAAETGLSHTTIYKHQKQLQAGDGDDEQMAWLKSQKDGFIGCIMRAADAGDLKAGKLLLEVMSKHQPQPKITFPIEQFEFAYQEIRELIPVEHWDKADATLLRIAGEKLTSDNHLKTA
jgi:hypothetical protein